MKGLSLSAAAAAVLLAAAPAYSQVGCAAEDGGCDIPEGITDYGPDYTVPDDGMTYKWSFVLSQPEALIFVPSPNQVEFFGRKRTATGFEDLYGMPFGYRFDEMVRPGVTTVFVRAPKGQDTCAQPGPIGEICLRYYRVWSNGASYDYEGIQGGFNLKVFVEAVPEPATWALMLGGFGLVGAAARNRRSGWKRAANACA